MHSRADTTIRFSHGERNFAAAREPKAFVEIGGDHNDALLANRAAYVAGAERVVQLAIAAEGKRAGEKIGRASCRERV